VTNDALESEIDTPEIFEQRGGAHSPPPLVQGNLVNIAKISAH
jgi:hypothetical protein